MGKLLTTAALAALLVACDNTGSEPEVQAVYTVEVVGQRFKIKVQGEAAIAALDARLQSGQEGVIHGRLLRGHGGFNSPWGWHLDPSSITTPDLAMEVCDGEPSFVQEELEYYLDNVKFYCPWGARVVSRGDP
jgi:hypothetical protein